MEENFNNPFIPAKVYKALPNILKNVTDNFSGREKDIVLTSALGVLSSVIPNVSGYYDSYLTYPNLFSIISAPPASGKGVVMKAKILAEKVHQKILEESLNQWNTFENDEGETKKDKPATGAVLKIVPANISSAELYNYMNIANDSVLIIESEADTMGNMLGNDWSNYSDVLRKSFHHEAISMSRKGDGVYIDVRTPKLSIVLSGTPAQLKSIINSKENGLLSRFIIYYFEDISEFKNVFEKRGNNLNELLEKQSKEVLRIFEILQKRENDLEFELTERQQQMFLKYFTSKHHSIISNENESLSFISNIHRLGLIFFRICMILSVYRESGDLSKLSKLTCSNKDFIICLRLIEVYYEHSLFNFKNIDQFGLSENDEELLYSVEQDFTREQLVSNGSDLGIPRRTVDDKLRQWVRKKIIRKVKKGHYKRL
ncbi:MULTISPECIES: DUF3987 domain-containing protein [Chryseobacterium]|uniref:DUF3987 domain-containing protein n=1 Tax=Chryseobacterium TaxID=59732 RepID=UPI0028E3BF9F|nr:DUF3987 domain-containing protein [Chryseobacterium indoltheticum]